MDQTNEEIVYKSLLYLLCGTFSQVVDKLVAAYNVQGSSRVGFITFSNTASTVMSLTNTLTPAAMSATILNAPYQSEVTCRNYRIYSISTSMARNVLVLRDGVSTNPTATIASTNTAIDMGIRTFSVGIGDGVNQQDLLAIANGNQIRVFNANNFDSLVELLNPVSQTLCAN